MTATVSVAIPVRDGARALEETLAAVAVQRVDPSRSIPLLVWDSGSRDDSVGVARGFGAEVIEVPPERFYHGGTWNLLMQRSDGDHVAFLTRDAVPADENWLGHALQGFAAAKDVGPRRSMCALAGPQQKALDIGPVADDVARRLDLGARLRRHPRSLSGAEADDRDASAHGRRPRPGTRIIEK